MDGVEDLHDQCAYTPFTDLVDEDGCSIERLVASKPSNSFTLLAALSYADTDYNTFAKTDTFTTSLSLDYTYKKLLFSVSTSYYKNENDTYSASGFNDTYLTGEYRVVDDVLYLGVGVGVILPTYEDSYGTNRTDYLANINFGYTIEDVNIFSMYGYTLVNDEDVAQKSYYQNTHYGALGVGYFFSSKFYASVSYSVSQSIYKDVEDIRSASVFGYYTLSELFFINANYTYGLSDSASDTFISLSLGYKF
jgi:hypothetical protein